MQSLHPTAEQKLLQDGARRFVAQEYSWENRRRRIAAELRHDPAIWAKFADLGWLAAAIPEESGGLGGTEEAAVIAEQLGRALALEPYEAVAVSASRAIHAAVDFERRTALLEALMSGSVLPVLAHGERYMRDDRHELSMAARNAGDGRWLLTGCKTPVLAGPIATDFLVSAAMERSGETLLFHVPAATPGLSLRTYRTIDGRPAADLAANGVPVTTANLMARGDAAQIAIDDAIDHGIVTAAASAVGTMERAVEIAGEYLNVRKQFGVPIATFQALRHRLADMHIESEMARSMLVAGLLALSEPAGEPRAATISAVKARVAQAGVFVTEQAIHLHGAIGMTEEYVIGHHYKRMITFDWLGGSSAFHVERYARQNIR
jgi:alkylation response protein AidB-like acyl-CoA dehydrogenase